MKIALLMIIILLTACAKKPVKVPVPAPPLVDMPEPEVELEPVIEMSPVVEDRPLRFASNFPVIYFEFDQYILRDVEMAKLRQVIDLLEGDCTVEGHACRIGADEYNLSLSEHRAQRVREWLKTAGYPHALTLRAFGEERPTGGEFAYDRRVVVKCH